MQAEFEFEINGRPYRVAGDSIGLNLLDYLRDNLLTAAKGACASGGCGACSVLLADRDGNGEPAYRAINACQVSLPMLAGRELWTAEGVGDDHPVAQQLATSAGHSCGYCLPGACVTLCEAFESHDELTVGEAIGQTVGNLCRCTGYQAFRDALVTSIRRRSEADPSPTALGESLPKRFEGVPPLIYRDADGRVFYRPSTTLEALRLSQAHPRARFVAGGTSRGWTGRDETDAVEPPQQTISLEAVAELSSLSRDEDWWSVGACVTIAGFALRLQEEFPLVADMAGRFGSVQIRNRATVGGNLVAAAHHSDLVPLLLALGAKVRIESVEGAREIDLEDLFVGFRQTAVAEGELLGAVLIPRPAPVGSGAEVVHRLSAFYKVSKRRHLDRAIANAAFLVELDADGVVRKARLALGGLAAYGARAYDAEDALVGSKWEPKTAQSVATLLKDSFAASSDQRATAAYRNALAAGLWQKFFAEHRRPGKPMRSDAAVRRFHAKPVAG